MIQSSVLIAGSSGFIGSRLLSGFHGMFMKVDGLARSNPSDIQFDLSKGKPLDMKYDCVVHCAGKAHSDKEWSKSDFENDVAITQNLLSSLSKDPPKFFVYISSVSVYGLSSGILIDELVQTNPHDLYGKSKLISENKIVDWCNNYNVSCLILRLPLVVGRSAPGNFGKLASALKKKRFFLINGNEGLKSMVLIDDVISFVKQMLISHNLSSGIYNLTDGTQIGFNSFVIKLSRENLNSIPFLLPATLVKCLAFLGNIIPFSPINIDTYRKMTNNLTFSSSKAEMELGWRPSKVMDNLNGLIL